jgi:hypothetical protein
MTAHRGMESNDLALWYLRLNGFFTVPNFVLHPERRGSQQTEADIVAVRFPHRAEFDNDPHTDDPRFATRVTRPCFVIAESTNGPCKLNEPWTRPSAFCYVLRAFGPVAAESVPVVAARWAETGVYSDGCIDCALLCFGASKDSDLIARYPRIDQLLWRDVVAFFHQRFSTYDRRKRDHEQWDLVGNTLWDLWKDSGRDEEQFWAHVREVWALPPNKPMQPTR